MEGEEGRWKYIVFLKLCGCVNELDREVLLIASTLVLLFTLSSPLLRELILMSAISTPSSLLAVLNSFLYFHRSLIILL